MPISPFEKLSKGILMTPGKLVLGMLNTFIYIIVKIKM